MIRKKLVASATAIALLGIGAQAPAMANPAPVAQGAETQASQVAPITQGKVNWPIKASFLGYLQSPFAAGQIHVSDGAEKVLNSRGQVVSFDLPVDTANARLDQNGNGTVPLLGTIQLYAHHGLGPNGGWGLDVNFSNFVLTVQDGTNATLSADWKTVGANPATRAAVENSGQNAPLVHVALSEALVPATDKTYDQRQLNTTFGEGTQASLVRYEAGDVADDGKVSVFVNYGEAGDAPDYSGDQQGGGSSFGGSSNGILDSIINTINSIIKRITDAISGLLSAR